MGQDAFNRLAGKTVAAAAVGLRLIGVVKGAVFATEEVRGLRSKMVPHNLQQFMTRAVNDDRLTAFQGMHIENAAVLAELDGFGRINVCSV